MLYNVPPTLTGNPRREKVTPEQAAGVRAWLGECELGWLAVETPQEAGELEARLRLAYLPPLNRI